MLSCQFFAVGFFCFWADSEIWAVKISGLVGEDRDPYLYWVKPLFHLILFPMLGLSEKFGLHHMDWARMLFALNGIGASFLFSRLLKKLTNRSDIAFVFFIILLNSFIFLERGFRVRSDLLVMTVLVIMVTVLVRKKNSLESFSWSTFATGTFLALLISLKSVFLVLCFIPVYGPSLRFGILRNKKLFTFGVLGLLSVCISGVLMFPNIWVSVSSQLTYLLQSFFDPKGALSAFRFYRFEHVIRFLSENPLIFLLMGFKKLWIFKNWVYWKSHKTQYSLDLSILGLIGFLIVFPNRLPFLIASLTPWFLLFGLNYPSQQFVKWSKVIKPWFVSCALTAVVVTGVWKSYQILSKHNKFEQYQFFLAIEDYLNLYEDQFIYDPSGIARSIRAKNYYLGPNQLQVNQWVLERIESEKPDIILQGQRWEWVRPFVAQEFLSLYDSRQNSEIYVKGELFEIEGLRSQISISEIEIYLAAQILSDPRVYFRPLSKRRKLDLLGVGLLKKGEAVQLQNSRGFLKSKVMNSEYLGVPNIADELVIFIREPHPVLSFQPKKLLRFDSEF